MDLIRGHFVNGSAVVFKKEDGLLVQGLEFDNGNIKWLNYDWWVTFHGDRAVVDNGSRMGYIDRFGRECIPMIYMCAEDYSEGRVFVNDGDKTYLIDTDGNVYASFNEALVTSEFINGTAIVSRITQDGYNVQDAVVDREGRFVLEFAPDRTIRNVLDMHMNRKGAEWHEGLLIGRTDDGKWTVTDLLGNSLTSDDNDANRRGESAI